MIQRYTANDIASDARGEFCLYADYQNLEAENKRLMAIAQTLAECGDPKPWKIDEWIGCKKQLLIAI